MSFMHDCRGHLFLAFFLLGSLGAGTGRDFSDIGTQPSRRQGSGTGNGNGTMIG